MSIKTTRNASRVLTLWYSRSSVWLYSPGFNRPLRPWPDNCAPAAQCCAPPLNYGGARRRARLSRLSFSDLQPNVGRRASADDKLLTDKAMM